jgi:hypothetical protein
MYNKRKVFIILIDRFLRFTSPRLQEVPGCHPGPSCLDYCPGFNSFRRSSSSNCSFEDEIYIRKHTDTTVQCFINSEQIIRMEGILENHKLFLPITFHWNRPWYSLVPTIWIKSIVGRQVPFSIHCNSEPALSYIWFGTWAETIFIWNSDLLWIIREYGKLMFLSVFMGLGSYGRNDLGFLNKYDGIFGWRRAKISYTVRPPWIVEVVTCYQILNSFWTEH